MIGHPFRTRWTSSSVPHRVFRHSGPVRSLEQAARERGQRPEQVVRSILFRLGHDLFAMVLVAGPDQVAWKSLRQIVGQSRLTMASEARGAQRNRLSDRSGCAFRPTATVANLHRRERPRRGRSFDRVRRARHHRDPAQRRSDAGATRCDDRRFPNLISVEIGSYSGWNQFNHT